LAALKVFDVSFAGVFLVFVIFSGDFSGFFTGCLVAAVFFISGALGIFFVFETDAAVAGFAFAFVLESFVGASFTALSVFLLSVFFANFVALPAMLFFTEAFARETGAGFAFAETFGRLAEAFAAASFFVSALEPEGFFKVFSAVFREVPAVFFAGSFAALAEDLDVV